MEINKLVAQCIKRDKTAEKELFYLFLPKIYGICRRYTKSDQDAEDLVQDCFIKIYDVLKKYNPKKAKFSTWLHSICVNVALMKLRKDRRKLRVEYVAEIPDQLLEDQDLSYVSEENLLKCIRELPLGYQMVLNLYIYENYTHKEIAEKIGIRESTSRSQLTRAKALLKKIIIRSKSMIYEAQLP